jgi:putative DNA primase/helicase
MRDAAFEAWKARAKAVRIEDEVARRDIKLNGKLNSNGVERDGPCPRCGGTDRFSYNIKKQTWNCRGCKTKADKGDVIGMVQWLDGCDFIAACTTLNGGDQPPKGNSKPREIVVSEFFYEDASGVVVSAQERVEYLNPDGTSVLKDGKRKKIFRQKRPDPDRNGKWIKKVTDDDGKPLVPVVPYRLPQVLAAVAAGQEVLIVEGEGKADLLASWNVVATCNAGGANKWRAEHAAFLKDANVVLVPDHDDVGWQHVHLVGASLVGVAKRIRILVLPDLPTKGDVIDWARSGGTREQLDELIAKAPDWETQADLHDGKGDSNKDSKEKAEAERSEAELLDALAKMPKGLARGRERRRLAEQLGVSRSDIDAEIEERRTEAETTALLHGHWHVEPWPEPVEGNSLIRDIVRKLQKHVVLTHEGALAIALWVMLAWVHDEVATHSPILDAMSAEPESGKTTLLGIVWFLAPRAISSVDISRAALYRSIQRWQPSFVIDEFDTVLADAKNNPDKAELRSVINSGHTRGQGVLRCVTDEHTPELFSTFAPKAIGMIGRRLPPATMSRCIVIELYRRKKDERIVKFKHEDDSELANLRSRLRRWSMDNIEALRNAEPLMPADFENRRADNWRVQFKIADLCSGTEDWGDKARAAAAKIEGKSDSRTINVLALADIKVIFFPKDHKGRDLEPLDRIASAELIAKLCTYSDSPWAEWKGGKPITQAQLARVLKPFGIAPGSIWLGESSGRGYLRTQFDEAWERYL